MSIRDVLRRFVSVLGGIFGFGDDVMTVVVATQGVPKPPYARTDSGNAELFAALYGKSIRFDHKRERWLLWDSSQKRWCEDKQSQVRGLMKLTARYRRDHAAAFSDDVAHEYKWAVRSESRAAIDAALELAKSESPMSDDGEGWDADPWLFRVANGIVDLRTGTLREATRADRMIKASPVTFGKNANCPRFEQFIAEIFGDDRELIHFVQKVIGYSLTGSVAEQCLFACHGDGSNGKSTLLEVLLFVLGDYGIDLPFSALEAKRNGNPPGEGVSLPGARFAKVVEIREGRHLDEARIKSWTGGDVITVNPKHKKQFSFEPTHKLWLAFNHKPVISDSSTAMWRRIRMIPFLQRFEGKQKDRALLEKLKAEAPGILNWAIEGCLRWQAEGLDAPKPVADATREYQDESDALTPFLEDRCRIDATKFAVSAELWTAYLDWATENNEPTMNRKIFADHLKRRGFTPDEHGHGKTRIWRGLELLQMAARVDAGTENMNLSN